LRVNLGTRFIAVYFFGLAPAAFAGDAKDCENANLKATRIEACDRLIAAHPARDEALAKLHDLRAQAHQDMGNYAAEAADRGVALRLRPENADALVQRGIAYFRAEDTSNALSDFNAAVIMAPQNAVARRWRGRAYRGMEQYANAEADLNLAVTLDPKDPNSWVVRGWLYADTKRYREAISDFDAAGALVSDDIIPVYNRARAHVLSGDHKAALPDLDRCSQIDPDDPDCYELKGDALHRLSRYKDAVEAYGQAISRTSNSSRLLKARAEALRKVGDFDGAIRDLTSALRIDGEMQTLYDRGWIYALSGRPDNAIADYSLILRREGAGSWPSALIERAMARVVRGDLRAAADDFDTARSVAPSNARAALWRAALSIRLNRDSVWADWRQSDAISALKRERPKLEASKFEAPFVQAILGERDLAEAHRVAHMAARTSEDPVEAACFADMMSGALALAQGDGKAAEQFYAQGAARSDGASYACLIATAELNRLRAQ
jgi:tetratricopeptide (TPR) repeat protein